MLKWITALFIIVPALEIWAMLQMGKLIGGWQTFLLIVMTGFIGAYLAKREASKVFGSAREQMAVGQLPAGAVMDGICIFLGGLLLMSPGFLTDVVGFLLVFPVTRPLFKLWIGGWLKQKLERGQFTFFTRR